MNFNRILLQIVSGLLAMLMMAGVSQAYVASATAAEAAPAAEFSLHAQGCMQVTAEGEGEEAKKPEEEEEEPDCE